MVDTRPTLSPRAKSTGTSTPGLSLSAAAGANSALRIVCEVSPPPSSSARFSAGRRDLPGGARGRLGPTRRDLLTRPQQPREPVTLSLFAWMRAAAIFHRPGPLEDLFVYPPDCGGGSFVGGLIEKSIGAPGGRSCLNGLLLDGNCGRFISRLISGSCCTAAGPRLGCARLGIFRANAE